MSNPISEAAITAAQTLSNGVDALTFAQPTTHVYNPLAYAWAGHRNYLERHAHSTKRILFLGMNPGPFGMAQTGVPFGEVSLVRDWVGVKARIHKPVHEHPKRRIEGFDCLRSEVSGRRLWGLFKQRFESATAFFEDHFVANYCPLVFMEASGRNRTPDKLPADEVAALYALCDTHLRELVGILQPEWVIGVGAFAASRAQRALQDCNVQIGQILHPSPASPAANRGWSEQATQQLERLALW